MHEARLKFEVLKNEMVPVPGFEDYYCHVDRALVYSTISNRWLLQGKGTGDDNKYWGTQLKCKTTGEPKCLYLHEIVYSCRNGIKKADWRSMPIPFEIDHQNRSTKDCNPNNLNLTTSKGNKANKVMVINRNRVSLDIARQLRAEFKLITKNKIHWYEKKGKELGIGKRSVQNIILENTYKEPNN
jgi:hypothetical protein